MTLTLLPDTRPVEAADLADVRLARYMTARVTDRESSVEIAVHCEPERRVVGAQAAEEARKAVERALREGRDGAEAARGALADLGILVEQ